MLDSKIGFKVKTNQFLASWRTPEYCIVAILERIDWFWTVNSKASFCFSFIAAFLHSYSYIKPLMSTNLVEKIRVFHRI